MTVLQRGMCKRGDLMKLKLAIVFFSAILAVQPLRARAAMYITEWAYNAAYQGTTNGEFVEFTNIGDTPIDMTGWSFDDISQVPGSTNLSAFGVVAPYESVILTDVPAAGFRTEWGLPSSVKVIGDNTQNLSRADEINLYNGATRVDWLTYDDQTLGGPRTNAASGNPKTLAAVGAHNPTQWILSTAGDAFGSHVSVGGTIGNPGVFTLVPEPSVGGLLALVLAAWGLRPQISRGHYC